MTIPEPCVAALRCPSCRSGLTVAGQELRCERGHRFGFVDGLLTLAEPDPGKYDRDYATRYAAVWAYGFQTLRRGENESLYRTVASLAAESLLERYAGVDRPIIIDAGCGVGRVAADCAALIPAGFVLGFDASPHMLHLALRITTERGSVKCDLGSYGFGELTVHGRGLPNVLLARADVTDVPVIDNGVDLVLSINVVDRLLDGPEPAVKECMRMLKPGGGFVFCDPLNWAEERWWKEFGSTDQVLELIAACGFEIVTWFDRLPYRELLDARGSFQEFTTLVVRARKR